MRSLAGIFGRMRAVEVGSGGEETYDTKLKPNPQIANEYGDILREGVFSIIPTEVPLLPNSIPTSK